MILHRVSDGRARSLTDSGGPRPRALGLAHAKDAEPGVRLDDGGNGRRGRFEVQRRPRAYPSDQFRVLMCSKLRIKRWSYLVDIEVWSD
jgi:hypothetical protein